MLQELIINFIIWARSLGNYISIQEFLQRDLLIIDLLLLGIGFSVLLIEIRLPLKYYWSLPSYALKKLFEIIHVLPPEPVWGRVLDEESGTPIPLTAVDLIHKKNLRVMTSTYTNRVGQFGFHAPPGEYFVRAVKNHYSMPSFLDPENIELLAVDESFAITVIVDGKTPEVDIQLLQLEIKETNNWQWYIWHYFKTALIAASNASLFFSIIISYIAWVIGLSPLYGLLISVGVLLLFVKIYILEAVGLATQAERHEFEQGVHDA